MARIRSVMNLSGLNIRGSATTAQPVDEAGLRRPAWARLPRDACPQPTAQYKMDRPAKPEASSAGCLGLCRGGGLFFDRSCFLSFLLLGGLVAGHDLSVGNLGQPQWIVSFDVKQSSGRQMLNPLGAGQDIAVSFQAACCLKTPINAHVRFTFSFRTTAQEPSYLWKYMSVRSSPLFSLWSFQARPSRFILSLNSLLSRSSGAPAGNPGTTMT